MTEKLIDMVEEQKERKTEEGAEETFNRAGKMKGNVEDEGRFIAL